MRGCTDAVGERSSPEDQGWYGANTRCPLVTPAPAAILSCRSLSRQPIYDRYRQVHAYEMLFRGLEDTGEAHLVGGTTATAQLITQGWLLSGFDSLADGRWMFVNFTRDLLVGGAALLFNPARDVVKVLEDIPPDRSVLESCCSLRESGYGVALDDVERMERIEQFDGAVTIAKINITNLEVDELAEIVRTAQVQGVELLAEKIETVETLRLAEGYGFDYFQGYYLSRPESMRRPALPGLSPAHAQLLEVVIQRELDANAVIEVKATLVGCHAAFSSRDSVAQAAEIHFPHVRVTSGNRFIQWTTAEDFQASQDELTARLKAEEWDHTEDTSLEVVHAGEDKVHFALGAAVSFVVPGRNSAGNERELVGNLAPQYGDGQTGPKIVGDSTGSSGTTKDGCHERRIRRSDHRRGHPRAVECAASTAAAPGAAGLGDREGQRGGRSADRAQQRSHPLGDLLPTGVVKGAVLRRWP